ncbi:RNA polymerase II C-terminal domain phosphatase-like 4 [Citrus sinensis]|uniref:RNA polymerase II C-terminal domain phosphatase-like 4 n=1 Tax=Citrus sinensis TaxID=2711 RepID=A0ACB8P915_CITSI|nr:RNA polymerase II C-terminal domain phosphatase-like 4 [Citrus sinensis]
MSVATDSPVHSPSIDDFAALLDAELDSNSLRLSPDKEADDEDENEEAMDDKDLKIEITLEHQGSTSLGIFEDKTVNLFPYMLYCAEVSLETDNCLHPGSLGACVGPRVGNDKIDRLWNTNTKHLLRHRKLYLILELDHTLLNWNLLLHLTPEEDYLKNVSKRSLFMLAFMNIMTKLRPVVHAFFIEASGFILMERYHFFASSCRQFGYHCQSLSQLRSVVSELEGALELANDLAGRDVRQREVLKGCKLVFSHAFPSKFPAHIHYLWKVVEQLGATCSIELDPSVTHSHWAAKEAKFLVDPRWIEAANFLWQGQLEEKFPVKQTKPEENFQAKQTKDQ